MSSSLMDGLDTDIYSLVNSDFTSGVKQVLQVCSKFLLYLTGPHIVTVRKTLFCFYVYYICKSLTYVYA